MGKGSVNKVILVGNVTADPEEKTFTNGNKVAKFGIATNEGYKNKQGEWVDKANFHTCKVFGNLVEVVMKYVKKGDKLYVDGSINYDTYKDKQDVVKYFTEIKVDEMTMLGSAGAKKTAAAAKPAAAAPPPPAPVVQEEEDDLPF